MASRSWKYFPNFSLTKEFVDHPFLGRKEVKGKGSPQKDAWAPCRAKNDSISSSRLIASQEKDEGVSWSRQKNAAGVWGNWPVLSLWWFNVWCFVLMCFAVWSGKVLFTSGLVEHLCSLSIKSLSTQRLCENYTIQQHVFNAWTWLRSYAQTLGGGAQKNSWLVGLLILGWGKKSLVQSKSKKWFTNSPSWWDILNLLVSMYTAFSMASIIRT